MQKGKVERRSALVYNIMSLWHTFAEPRFLRRLRKSLCLRGWEKRKDADDIRRRVEYYCRLQSGFSLGSNGKSIEETKLRDTHSCYWFDLMRYLRAFPKDKKIALINGDTWENPEYPVFAKARRLDDKTDNCVLMNLDSRRHFLKVYDPIPFDEKRGLLFFRGDVDSKENRRQFLKRWFGNPLFDLGDTSSRNKTEWEKERVPVEQHFNYKYILALEGHDVASALQWIMASNCIPVMPRPTVEGWLMHGALQPGKHYIEIADDFSDAEEKISYYNSHPEEARRISQASKEWASRFSDSKKEKIISYLVAGRYCELTK